MIRNRARQGKCKDVEAVDHDALWEEFRQCEHNKGSWKQNVSGLILEELAKMKADAAQRVDAQAAASGIAGLSVNANDTKNEARSQPQLQLPRPSIQIPT